MSDFMMYMLLLSGTFLLGSVIAHQLVSLVAKSGKSPRQQRLYKAIIRAMMLGPNLVVAGDGAMILPTYAALFVQSLDKLEHVILPVLIFVLLTLAFLFISYLWDELTQRRRPT